MYAPNVNFPLSTRYKLELTYALAVYTDYTAYAKRSAVLDRVPTPIEDIEDFILEILGVELKDVDLQGISTHHFYEGTEFARMVDNLDTLIHYTQRQQGQKLKEGREVYGIRVLNFLKKRFSGMNITEIYLTTSNFEEVFRV